MTILLILVAIFAILCWLGPKYDSGVVVVGAIICGVLLFIVALVLPVRYFSAVGEIERFKAVEATVQSARENPDSFIERASLTRDIVQSNKWLAGMKFWNNTIFDGFYPDTVEDLEPIR